ncbi:MAG: CopG family transcriptional regulator [Egibacteraceae bacterium]
MKRLQIMIEEEIDAALTRQAREEGVSKAAIIRRCVRQHVQPLPPLEEDPLWKLVGAFGSDEIEDEHSGRESTAVDAIVYR